MPGLSASATLKAEEVRHPPVEIGWLPLGAQPPQVRRNHVDELREILRSHPDATHGVVRRRRDLRRCRGYVEHRQLEQLLIGAG